MEPSHEREHVDITNGYTENGWFTTPSSIFNKHITEYKKLCRVHDGYPTQQEKCDEAYNSLKAEAEKIKVKLIVERIKLGSDPITGAQKAAWNEIRGLD